MGFSGAGLEKMLSRKIAEKGKRKNLE